MPKSSSKSKKKDWVSGNDMIHQGVPMRAWILLAAVAAVIIAVFVFWKPKAITIENIIPSGAVAFVRLDQVQDHLTELRSSRFWQSFSQANVPKILEYSAVDAKDVDGYNAWRDQMVGVIDHPLFKQFFGREAAVAFYPPAKATSSLDWMDYLSGTLMVTRIDGRAQVAEALSGIWSQTGDGWSTEQKRYKNTTITAVRLKNPRITVYYTRLRDLVVFSLSENLVASSIDTLKHKNLSLALDEDFNTATKTLYKAPDATVYLHMTKLTNFVAARLEQFSGHKEEEEGEEDGGHQNVLEDTRESLERLQGVKFAALSLSVGRPIKNKTRVLLDLPKMKPEIAATYQCEPADNATLNMIPKEAILYQWGNCLDFALYYHRLAEASGAEEGNPPFAELEKTWGFDIEEDLLPVLGNEMAWYLEEVDVKGLFPMPKLGLFLQIKNEKKAGDILKRIVTTPVTLVQREEYQGYTINFVSIPLFVTFRPSYAFINGYVVIATSDELVKASIDAIKDESKSLRGGANYKDLSGRVPQAGNGILFMNVKETARQALLLVEWGDKWFLQKMNQAGADVNAARNKREAIKTKIADKGKELEGAKDKFAALNKEADDLQAAYDANAVVAEGRDTLAQHGAAGEEGKPVGPSLEDIKFKKNQAAGIALEMDGIQREIDDLESQGPDLDDDISDFEQQKKDAEKSRYYADQVAVPLLEGLQSFSGFLSHTAFKDRGVESEILLKTE